MSINGETRTGMAAAVVMFVRVLFSHALRGARVPPFASTGCLLSFWFPKEEYWYLWLPRVSASDFKLYG